MKGLLGIIVTTKDSLEHVIGIVNAANKRGIKVVIFFTGEGVWQTQEPRFIELAGKARMSVCDVSFRAFNLKGEVPGLGFKDFATQAKLAEMLHDCSYHVVL